MVSQTSIAQRLNVLSVANVSQEAFQFRTLDNFS